MFSVTDTAAIFHFDTPSQTLTMAGAIGVRQFRFVDSVYYEKTYSVQTNSAHANGVCGRWGSAVVTFSNGYVLFDLNGKLSRTVNRQNLRSVRAFQGGSTLALQGKDSTVIADITAEGEAERLSVPTDSPVCVLDFGIVTQAGFYPYSVVEKQFTLPDLSSGGEFHVYTETPYFSSETHNFIFEATL
jgi:hypothetical protein